MGRWWWCGDDLFGGGKCLFGNIVNVKVNYCGGGYYFGGVKKFLYGLELVYLCVFS